MFKLNRYKKRQTKRKLELNGKKKDTHTCKRLVLEKRKFYVAHICKRNGGIDIYISEIEK